MCVSVWAQNDIANLAVFPWLYYCLVIVFFGRSLSHLSAKYFFLSCILWPFCLVLTFRFCRFFPRRVGRHNCTRLPHIFRYTTHHLIIIIRTATITASVRAEPNSRIAEQSVSYANIMNRNETGKSSFFHLVRALISQIVSSLSYCVFFIFQPFTDWLDNFNNAHT